MRAILGIRSAPAAIYSNAVTRCLAALLLFALSLGGLTLTGYSDQYVNGGVSWGPHEPIPLADLNPLGVNTFLEKEADPDKVTRSLDMIAGGGFRWIRQGFAWNDIEIIAKGNFTDTRDPQHVVSAWAKYDRIVDEAALRGIQIIARLDSPPVWARIPGDDVERWRKGPPAHNSDFADFVRAVALRYRGKIKYFQLWNEPNLWGEWGGYSPNPADYTALLKAGYEAVKGVDPQNVVVSAALAPTAGDELRATNDLLFLEGMYRAGAAPYFDVLSTMLYGLGQSPQERRTDLKRLNFSRPILLHQVMERNGDARKPIWISEYAWISLPPGWQAECDSIDARIAAGELDPGEGCGNNIWGASVNEELQAQWTVQGFERARAEWPWMGVMNVWYFREPDPRPREPANWFAIVNPDFTPRPTYSALKAYSAQLEAIRPTIEKPLWNALGFPFLYGVFGLLTLAAAAFGAGSLGRWAGAAAGLPRGRYSEPVKELARNGAAVVGMALLVGLYYKGSLPVIEVALAGVALLAFLKPSVGLAAVAFAVPFYWQPRYIGQQKFPIAETLLLLTFGAFATRQGIKLLLPGLAARLNMVGREADARGLSPASDPQPAGQPTQPAAEQEVGFRRLWSQLRLSSLDAPAVALLIVGALSLLTLADPAYTSDSARAFRWTIVEPLLFYFLIGDVVKSRRGLLRLADFFVAGATVVALYGLWQFARNTNVLDVEGVSRVVSVYRHPNNLALYLGRVLPFTVCLAIFLPWGWRKLVYALVSLPLAATLLLTYSRGAWVAMALAVGAALFAGWWWRPGRRSRSISSRTWAVAAVVGVLLIAAGIVAYPHLPERVKTLGSLGLRAGHWKSALHMIADHPLTGIGPDQFLNQLRIGVDTGHPRYLVNAAQQEEAFTSHPHNIVLDYWLSLGIMGLFVLVWLLWAFFREAINKVKNLAASASRTAADPVGRAIALGLLASMLDFLLHGMVDNSYFLMDLALIFWLSCGMLNGLRHVES